jgi:hypothetical protein
MPQTAARVTCQRQRQHQQLRYVQLLQLLALQELLLAAAAAAMRVWQQSSLQR